MLDLTKVEPQVETLARTIAAEHSFAQALLHGVSGRKTLVNLSAYPLPAGVLAVLQQTLGQPISEIRFPDQFDRDLPLRPQVAALINLISTRLRILNVTILDYLVLPELPAAAYLIAEAFTRADSQTGPGLVLVKQSGDTLVFVGVE